MINDPNRAFLESMAVHLAPLLDQLVFVGGAATGLLLKDPLAGPVRATQDIDVVAEVVSYAGYGVVEQKLSQLGFRPDTSEGAPVGRWLINGSKLDLAPLGDFLGFSNRWYKQTVATADRVTLSQGISIRLISAPCFLATKIEAFQGRGNGDFLASRDVSDILSVIDGRPEIIGELREADSDLRDFVVRTFHGWLGDSHFMEAVPGHVMPDDAGQEHMRIIVERLHAIARI